MSKKLQIYYDVQDSSYQRVVSMNAVLLVNESEVKYQHTEYRPLNTHDRDIAADVIRWAALESDELGSIDIEYGSNLDTTINKVLNLNDISLTKIEDARNTAWRYNVLREAHQNNIDRAGIIG